MVGNFDWASVGSHCVDSGAEEDGVAGEEAAELVGVPVVTGAAGFWHPTRNNVAAGKAAIANEPKTRNGFIARKIDERRGDFNIRKTRSAELGTRKWGNRERGTSNIERRTLNIEGVVVPRPPRLGAIGCD